MGYRRPVDPTGISTYWAHTHRTTPSSEAGVDYYCPIGTPVRAAADGRVVEVGGSVFPATGRFVTVDLDDGRRVRYLHLKSWLVVVGQGVTSGQIVGLSGASGYGTEYFGGTGPSAIPANTGGPHVHVTLWPGHYYQFGRYPLEPTLDFELYADKSTTAGSGSEPFPDSPIEEEMMRAKSAQTKNCYYFGPFGVITLPPDKHSTAAAINVASGGDSFPEMESPELKLLIGMWEESRAGFFEALGNTAAVAKIRADVAKVLALELAEPAPITQAELTATLRDVLADVSLTALTSDQVEAAAREALRDLRIIVSDS